MCKLNHKCPRKKKNDYYNLGAEEISKYDLKVENMKKKKTVLIGKKNNKKFLYAKFHHKVKMPMANWGKYL